MKIRRLGIVAAISLLGTGAAVLTPLVGHVQPVRACCNGGTMGQGQSQKGVYRDATGREYMYKDKAGKAVDAGTVGDFDLYKAGASGLDGMDVQTSVDEDGLPHFFARQKDPKRL